MFIRFLFVVGFFFFVSASLSLADNAKELDGTYSGTLKFDGAKEVPLEAALKAIGQPAIVKSKDGNAEEHQQEFEGAFIVDDDGGPYELTRALYHLEKKAIDMVYCRPGLKCPPEVPFSLLGKLAADGSISGIVTAPKVTRDKDDKPIKVEAREVGTFKLSKK